MESEEFVEAIVREVYLSAANGVIELMEDPPGRAPRVELVELSKWYKSLDPASKVQAARHQDVGG